MSHPKVNLQIVVRPEIPFDRDPAHEKPVKIDPEYKTELSSGFDLQADFREFETPSRYLAPGETRKIETGVMVAVPPGYELQIRSRSGTSFKKGLVVLNSPGTIDADYRGEVCILLHNGSMDRQVVYHGERIAQAVLCPVVQASFSRVNKLDETVRGAGGFGSTGT